ncbi:hypothetical protein HOV93_49410 [Planctomycetes bacterium FF15]|uniref:Uncharacterized protein n=1 Tax=Bremerella alba TaxID=980252 RepID=A0A7V8VA32_9BACT|nr:hypothetical protein [Bremerella alba]
MLNGAGFLVTLPGSVFSFQFSAGTIDHAMAFNLCLLVSPKGATVNSQGRKPLVVIQANPSPNGASDLMEYQSHKYRSTYSIPFSVQRERLIKPRRSTFADLPAPKGRPLIARGGSPWL